MAKMGAASTSRSSSSQNNGEGSSGGNGSIFKRPVGRPRKSAIETIQSSSSRGSNKFTSRSKSTNEITNNIEGSTGSMRASRSGRKIQSAVAREEEEHEEEDDDDDEPGNRSFPVRRQTSSQRRNLAASTSASKMNEGKRKYTRKSQTETKRGGRKSKGEEQSKLSQSSKRSRTSETPLKEIQDSNGDDEQEEEMHQNDEETRQKRIEEENALMERWQEEYFEIVEQLPLELRRSYTLMRELETKFQDKIDFIASQAKAYKDARKAYGDLTHEQKALQVKVERRLEQEREKDNLKDDTMQQEEETTISAPQNTVLSPSSDADGEYEDDAEVYHELSGEPLRAETSPSVVQSSSLERGSEETSPFDRAPSTVAAIDSPISSTTFNNLVQLAPTKSARLSLLSEIAKSSNESIRIAEEKIGLAVTAYEWVDRQIRRLDADLQKSENTLLLGLRAGTEASRGLQDALGIDYANGQGAHRWDDIEALLMGRSTRKQVNTTTTTTTKTRKGKVGKGGDDTSDEEEKQSAAGISGSATEMAIDPNEPTYCYCDEVSSGEMIACDNEDCPREWFHLTCVGFDQPPKGRWFCLFCAAVYNFKGSGTFPDGAPCLPPHLQSISSSYANSKNRKGGRGVFGNKRKRGSFNIPSNKLKRR